MSSIIVDLWCDVVINKGADGLVVWGSLWEPGTAAHPNAQWGPYGKDSPYQDYVRTQTGPMIQHFRAVAVDCANEVCACFVTDFLEYLHNDSEFFYDVHSHRLSSLLTPCVLAIPDSRKTFFKKCCY